MAASVKQMLAAANGAAPRIAPQQAREMIARGNALIVDLRDAPEVDKSGKERIGPRPTVPWTRRASYCCVWLK